MENLGEIIGIVILVILFILCIVGMFLINSDVAGVFILFFLAIGFLFGIILLWQKIYGAQQTEVARKIVDTKSRYNK